MSKKFDEYFADVQPFSNGAHVLSGTYSIDEAADLFSEYMGENVEVEYVEKERVRFGYAPESVEDMAGQSCWYTGASEGNGSKLVWIVNP